MSHMHAKQYGIFISFEVSNIESTKCKFIHAGKLNVKGQKKDTERFKTWKTWNHGVTSSS